MCSILTAEELAVVWQQACCRTHQVYRAASAEAGTAAGCWLQTQTECVCMESAIAGTLYIRSVVSRLVLQKPP